MPNTADENFGYAPGQPTGHPAGPQTYSSEFEMPGGGTSMDLSAAMIEEISMAIANEDPNGIRSGGYAWEKISDQLVESMRALRTAGTTLQENWESPSASEAFLGYVGRSTWSIEDWQSAAGTNAGALHTLATMVGNKKSAMVTLMGDYTAALIVAAAKDEAKPGQSPSERQKVREEYSRRARDEVATPLDSDYRDAFFKVTRGAMWQGPTDAAITGPPAPGAPGGPGGPGGPGVAPPGPGGTAPAGPGAGMRGAPARPTALLTTTAPTAPVGGIGHAPTAPGGLGTAPIAPPASLGGLGGTPPQAPDSSQLAGMQQQLESTTAAPTAPGVMPAGLAAAAPGGLTGRGAAPAPPSGFAPGGNGSSPAPGRPGGSSAPMSPRGAGGPAPGAPLTGRPTAPGAGPGGRGMPPGSPMGQRPGAPSGPTGTGRGLAGRTAPAAAAAPKPPSGPGTGAPANGLGGRHAPSGPGGSAPRAPRGPDAGFARKPAAAAGPSAPSVRTPAGPAPAQPGLAAPARPAAAPTAPRGGIPDRLAGRGGASAAARTAAAGRPSVATSPAIVAKDLNGRLGIKPTAGRGEIARTVRAAIRERLAGRAAMAAAAAQPPRSHPGDEAEDLLFEALAHYDDEDLFTILAASPAVIDRIKPSKKVTDPGPAIGVPAT